MRRTIATDGAPKAIGPYAQAVLVDGWLWCSGQIPLDPATGQVVPGDAAAQAERVLANLDAVVKAAGATLADAVKVTVYLKDMGAFPAVNEVYARRFPSAPPARATVEVARLPKDVLVEMDLVARVPGGGVPAYTEGSPRKA
jgi:2-iminobutanoate/2-iminopropanoate deaminase